MVKLSTYPLSIRSCIRTNKLFILIHKFSKKKKTRLQEYVARPRLIPRLTQHDQDQDQDWVDNTKTNTFRVLISILIFASLFGRNAN